MKKIKKILFLFLICVLVSTQVTYVRAEEPDDGQVNEDISTARDTYRTKLHQFYSNLKYVNKIDQDLLNKMDKIYNSGMDYINNASFTYASEIGSYEGTVEVNISEVMKRQPTATKEFIMLSNIAQVSEAKYDQDIMVVLSLINLGNVDVKNVVVTPKVSNDKTKWPFDITQPYDAQYIPGLLASTSMEDAMTKRMDIGWNFKVRDDVLTGCYPLPFTVTYYMNGALETTELVTYLNVRGKDPKKLLVKDDDQLKSNPRIIVTGFTTTPETVYAGSIFTIAVQVKNTSKDTTVKNVLFNMEATVEGSTNEASYAAFLPTSGSSSVYTESIAPGATYDMSIEMEAKSDLAQKPYVLTVNMEYDTDEQVNVTNTAKVSVPIKQSSKLDLSSIDMSTESIMVGEEANVMFSIYNTGKTTLYNVKVTYEGNSIDGGGLTYVGNITPGQTGSVDSMVAGVAPDDGASDAMIVITYEDETGNETRIENPLNLSVYEMSFDENDFENYDDVPIEETHNSQIGLIVGIVIGVIIVAVVSIIFLKKRKQKKLHQKEIDMLDDEL